MNSYSSPIRCEHRGHGDLHQEGLPTAWLDRGNVTAAAYDAGTVGYLAGMGAASGELAVRESADERFGTTALGALSLAAANLGLLLVYVSFDLTLEQLVLVFWWESFWIGLFCALKLLVASLAGNPFENRWVQVSPAAALLVSIAAIGFITGEFLALFLLTGAALWFALTALSVVDPGELLRDELPLILGTSLLFLAGHGLSFVVNFLAAGEFRSARAATLLVLPFRRCLALLAAIGAAFAAAWLLPGIARTTGFIAVLVLLKLLGDYRLHRRERLELAAAGRTGT